MISEPVVIGAGPAGLAVAATLARQGQACVVLERAESVGASWQGRYDSLRLHTVRWLSGLPGAPIPRRYGRWVARDDFVSYLRNYAERFGVRPEFGVEVRRIDQADEGWSVQTSQGERTASAVVVATGYSRVPHLPDWPGRAGFTGTLLHSVDYREPSPYRGQHVLVVGAGNSAAEIAVDLARAGARVDLSVRTPPNIMRRDTFGPQGDGFTQFLRTRTVPILDHGFVSALRAGRIRVLPTIESFDDLDVRMSDGSTLCPDVVLCATGNRTGLEPLVGHLGALDERGLPRVHCAQTLPELPGLYFVGVTVQLA